MKRRTYLHATGFVTAVGVAGCLGDGADDSTTDDTDDSATDGADDSATEDTDDSTTEDTDDSTTEDTDDSTTEDTDDSAAEDTDDSATDYSAANEFDYETVTFDGVEVPLVPTEDAIEWYESGETVFVDARGQQQFEELRIGGAVLSPAPNGLDADDPVAELSTDTRLVTYCVCPHALAAARGASVVRDGYVHTYALKEGLQEWVDAGHPLDGTQAAAAHSVEFDHSYEEQLG